MNEELKLTMKNWQLELEAYYLSWELDWYSTWYYEDWTLAVIMLMKNWQLTWDVVTYDENWELLSFWPIE